MHLVAQYLTPLLEFCAKFHSLYPIGSLVFAGIAVLIPILYYRYCQHLKYWTFNTREWTSYEVEKCIRCNALVKDGKLTESLTNKITKEKGAIKTVYECFMHGMAISNDGPCLGQLVDDFSRYEWLRFSEVQKQAQMIGRLLRSHGLERQQCVGIYAANSAQWIISELACVFQSMVTVPLYDTLGPESIRHTIIEVEMPVIFCDSEDKLKQILAERKHFPFLKMFVLFRDQINDAALAEQCKSEGIELLAWPQAKSLGAEHSEIKDDPPTADDTLLIQYTSGTTGISKGVVLTHRNMVACVSGSEECALFMAKKGIEMLNPKDSVFLFLPLAHAYGQSSTTWFLYTGGRIGVSSGNVQRLIKDSNLMQPTYFPLVPRIMNRVYSKVMEEPKKGFKGWLFQKCYDRKKALLKTGCLTRDSIYDLILFRKLQNMIGGKVRFMTTGSAPLAPEVLEFWRVVFGAVVIEGYGQTESTSVTSCAVAVEGGNVGHPTTCCMIRLLDVPEMGYLNEHNRGEICLKGHNITSGYYKRPDLDKETFTPDGWLRTGDIGEFLPDGSLRMIDRKKHIFKLSQGEYVAPEKIESVYAECPLVANVYVDGNSLQPYVVAVVVPDEQGAKDWAVGQGLGGASLVDLCKNNKFQRRILDALLVLGKEKRLNSIEQVKSLYLHPEPFTIANGLLTPSLKNRRADLRRRFQAEVEAIYNAGPMIGPK